jgi:Peptidase S24-like
MQRHSTDLQQPAQVYEFPTGKPRNEQPNILVSSPFETAPTFDLHANLILHPSSTYFVRADGNQLYHAGIRNNDILIVDCALKPDAGDIVVIGSGSQLHIERHTKDARTFGTRGKVLYSIHAIGRSAR